MAGACSSKSWQRVELLCDDGSEDGGWRKDVGQDQDQTDSFDGFCFATGDDRDVMSV